MVLSARWRKREAKLINHWLAYAPAILISSHWGNNTAQRSGSRTAFAKSCARQYKEHADNIAHYRDDDIKSKKMVVIKYE